MRQTLRCRPHPKVLSRVKQHSATAIIQSHRRLYYIGLAIFLQDLGFDFVGLFSIFKDSPKRVRRDTPEPIRLRKWRKTFELFREAREKVVVVELRIPG